MYLYICMWKQKLDFKFDNLNFCVKEQKKTKSTPCINSFFLSWSKQSSNLITYQLRHARFCYIVVNSVISNRAKNQHCLKLIITSQQWKRLQQCNKPSGYTFLWFFVFPRLSRNLSSIIREEIIPNIQLGCQKSIEGYVCHNLCRIRWKVQKVMCLVGISSLVGKAQIICVIICVEGKVNSLHFLKKSQIKQLALNCKVEQNLYLLLGIASEDDNDDDRGGDNNNDVINVVSLSYQYDKNLHFRFIGYSLGW